MPEISLADRLLVGLRTGPLEPIARRALLKAVHLLGLALGQRLRELRAAPEPLMCAHARIEEQAVLLGLSQEIVAILGERWDKVPDRHRPHYTPSQRFRIVRLKRLLDLSPQDAAHLFRVSPETIARWQAELRTDQATTGTIVRPTPPLRRYADVLQHTVQTMALLGFQGYETIAATLARAGWKISATTVGRLLRRPRVPEGTPPQTKTRAERAVRARYPNHVWMMDLTHVPALFGLRVFTIAGIIDVFSRAPIAARLFDQDPPAYEVARLFTFAARTHGRPRHFVTDQGTQFKARRFQRMLRALGVRQRFGAVGKTGSIAIIERFWRSLKEALRVRLWRPLTREDLERRLALALTHYAVFRPHQALGGATPLERYTGLMPASADAVHPPRGRPGEGPRDPPFRVEHLDRDGRFPVLRRAA